MTLDLTGKCCPIIFSTVHFQEIMHAKMQVFLNQPWQQMRALLILLFGKTKALFAKDATRKKHWFLHMSFVENERETCELKWRGGGGGVCFSMKSKATCKN